MADLESKTYQILANILLAIGAVIAITAIFVHPDQFNSALAILAFTVVIAFGTRFSRVFLPLLGLADVALVVRFFV